VTEERKVCQLGYSKLIGMSKKQLKGLYKTTKTKSCFKTVKQSVKRRLKDPTMKGKGNVIVKSPPLNAYG
jgi:hypothetical protein